MAAQLPSFDFLPFNICIDQIGLFALITHSCRTLKCTPPLLGLAQKRIVFAKLPELQPYDESGCYLKLKKLNSYRLGCSIQCVFERCPK